MKNMHGVIWTDVAESDLIEIIEYIAEDSPITAKRILKTIRERVEQLCHSPKKYRVVPELLDQGIAIYHEMIVAPWRIIFKMEKRNVFVLSVIDGRRNVEDVLLQRLTTRKLR